MEPFELKLMRRSALCKIGPKIAISHISKLRGFTQIPDAMDNALRTLIFRALQATVNILFTPNTLNVHFDIGIFAPKISQRNFDSHIILKQNDCRASTPENLLLRDCITVNSDKGGGHGKRKTVGLGWSKGWHGVLNSGISGGPGKKVSKIYEPDRFTIYRTNRECINCHGASPLCTRDPHEISICAWCRYCCSSSSCVLSMNL